MIFGKKNKILLKLKIIKLNIIKDQERIQIKKLKNIFKI